MNHPTLESIRRDLLSKIDAPRLKDFQAITKALQEAYLISAIVSQKLLRQPPGYSDLVQQNIELKERLYNLVAALKEALPILKAGHPENIPAQRYEKAADLAEAALNA